MVTHRATTSLLFGLALVASCTADHPPSTPGGGTTMGDGDGDGDIDAGDALDGGDVAFAIAGKVCVLANLRQPDNCDGDDGAMDVRLRGATSGTFTAADGSFTLPLAKAPSAVLVIGQGDDRVRRTTVRVSLGPNGVQGLVLRVPQIDHWNAIVANTVGVEPDNTTAIIAYLIAKGAPTPGAQVVQPTAATLAPFYDDPVAGWAQDGVVGPAGIALMFGVPVVDTEAEFTALGDNGMPTLSVTVPIADDTASLVRVEL